MNNTSQLKDVITTTLQEILSEDPNFFFNDKLTILTWKSKKIAGALVTKIGNYRYLGLPRKDRQGQDYWKYRPLNANSETSEKEGIHSELSQKEETPTEPQKENQPNLSAPNQLEPDNIAKFQQRQSQTQSINHGESNNSVEQSVNSQSS